MSSCLSGRAYGFDIENIIKCQTTSSIITSNSSSALSESSNSPRSNRKPRTLRKRPNQTYNEAVVLLSLACPKVFPTKNNLFKFTKQNGTSLHESPELLIENSGFFLHHPIMDKPNSLFESKVLNSYSSLGEFKHRNCNSCSSSLELCDGFGDDDFDTKSMLDEEIEEGIDSIMGNSNSNSTIEKNYKLNDNSCLNSKTCYGYPMGLGFDGNLEFNFGYGIRGLKNGDDGNWWRFPTVNVNVARPVEAVVPVKMKKAPVKKKKKKVEDLMKKSESKSELELGKYEIGGKKLLLKLNYDDVLKAWSDKRSPFPEEMTGSESPGGDIHARLEQIDLFSENGWLGEASVTRYNMKKHTRLFSKKIRYQVKKINPDRHHKSEG